MTTKQNAIAAMVNTMQAGAKAAKAKAAKAGKAVITLSQAEQVRIAREAGEAKGIELTQRETFDKAAKQLRDAKVIIGDARKCKVAQAFLAGRFGDAKVATQTKKNALTAFRKAVESGTAYNENAKRAEKAAAKKGAQTEPKAGKAEADTDTKKATHIGAAETATTYACTIARKGSAKKASQTLRDLLNKMRDAEEYAPLCALVIDALDEFDGTAE